MVLALLFILLILIMSWVCWTERCFLLQVFCITSVIKPKGESQNGCFEKTKHVKFSEKRNVFYPLIRTNVLFSENLTCFVFFETPVLRFALLPYDRRFLRCWEFRWRYCFVKFKAYMWCVARFGIICTI